MLLPIFNYNKIISEHTGYPELDMENTMLMLHSLEQSETTPISDEIKSALLNFEMWRTDFILNNKAVFNQASIADKKKSGSAYSSLMAKCLLRAEFYDWRSFQHSMVRLEHPILIWRNSTIQCSRPIKDLICAKLA